MPKRKSSRSDGQSSKRSATSSAVGRKWITDFGLATVHRGDFWRDQKGGAWTVEGFAKYVVSQDGPKNFKDIRRALLHDINHLIPHARNGSAYDELKSFCESADFSVLTNIAHRTKRAADCAQAAAISLAHQSGAQILVQKALGTPAVFSETESSVDETVVESESSQKVKEWVDQVGVAISNDDVGHVPLDNVGEDANVDTLFEDPNVMFVPNTKANGVRTADPASFMEWTLKSGKNVLQTINDARSKLNDKHREISLIWWGIIDVSGADKVIAGKHFAEKDISCLFTNSRADIFTFEELEEMRVDFYQEVELESLEKEKRTLLENISDDIQEKVDGSWDDFDDLLDKIEEKRYDKWGNKIRRVYQECLQNLMALQRHAEHASECTVDQKMTAFMIKTLVDPYQQLWKTDEGEVQSLGSMLARNTARSADIKNVAGQKCDLRIILADSDHRLEGLVALRSGGFPKPGFGKFHSDRVDLAVCLRDILFTFLSDHQGCDPAEVSQLFVLGSQGYDYWQTVYAMRWRTAGIFMLGTLRRAKHPGTIKSVATAVDIIYLNLRIEKTLHTIGRIADRITKTKSKLAVRGRRETFGPSFAATEVYGQPPLGGCIVRTRKSKG
ncbi:hypothetical protein SpCBS45565_g05942 [Spizellomyces sp. 'palustris']|nr:hypothetical protein SpCBS45565_g05942 [Spizellomyces sp. 'palustris']